MTVSPVPSEAGQKERVHPQIVSTKEDLDLFRRFPFAVILTFATNR